MRGAWIYFNGRCWQVKHWDDSERKAVVLYEYPTRGEAYRCAAWGIVK